MPNLTNRIEKSRPLRAGVAGLCLLFSLVSIAVNAINREAQEHKSGQDGARMTSVEATNEQILRAVLNPPPDQSEPTRRARIEEVLRNRYILTHANISPEILAKTAWPPTDWMNQQLADLHERWKFAEEIPKTPTVIQQVLPEPKKANVEFGFYTDAIPDNITNNLTALRNADSSVTIPITFRVTGDVTAHGIHIWIRICDQCVWKEEPSGFLPPDPHKPTDRDRFVGDLNPGPLFRAMDLHIGIPDSASSVAIGGFFTCDNCPPTNKDTRQRQALTFQVVNPTPPEKLTPDIPVQVQ
jgi:hypothetical protein